MNATTNTQNGYSETAILEPLKKGYTRILGMTMKVGSKKHLRLLNQIRIWNQTPFNQR